MADKKATKRETKPAQPFTLTTAWAAAVLALLVVLFFHEVTVGGRTFVSPDAVAPVGFVRIGEQSLYHDKVYPLWNPFVFLGMPSFGSGAYNPLIYPPDWPVALLQKALPLPDVTWMLIYYLLGGVFIYLLAREWGARPEGALLGAAAFVFQPNLVAVGSHGHGSQLVNSAYLPLMVWLASRWLRRDGLANLGLLALAGGFQFLRGHVQICFYTWIAIAVFALVHLVASARRSGELVPALGRAAALGVAAALAFGVAGVYNLPLRDYARYSIRGGGEGGGVGMTYATAWSLAPYELPEIVVPAWVGFGGATYWGGMPFTDYPNAYLGIVAVLLALPAFLPTAGGAARAPRVFALVLALFSLFVAFGSHSPVYAFLYDHVPQFNKFRVPVMVILLFQLSAALAAAWGWSAVLERGADAKRAARGGLERLLVAAAVVLVVAGVLAIAGQDAIRGGYVGLAMHAKPGFSTEAANAAFGVFASDLARVALLGLVAVVLAWFAARGKVGAALASLGMLGLLLIDVWPVSGRVMQPTIGEPIQRDANIGRDDVVDWLEKAGPWGSFRALVPGEFQSNRFAGFGVATVGGYHAAKPRLFQDLLDHEELYDPRVFSLLNVRYIVLSQPLTSPPPTLRMAYQGAAGVVYENLAALPRATVVGAFGIVPDTGRAAIDSIRAGTHEASTFTWLTRDPGVTLGSVDGARATITRYGLHDVEIGVETPGAALLRLADLWYPDWSATVDGKPTPILRADHALRAVVVPAGSHRVAFRFRSASVRRGLMLSLASTGLALLLVGAGLWLDRRGKGAGAGGAAA